uniref:Protein translocase subunit SecA n=1 Tax=Polysiphonia sertularioides TaxID=945028 RepID=A0A1Z1M965_9FLOR|nr:preprotein-translocase subunit a [Polysiphonia sertularioides]ARW62433.1 preprotein-translocase subunit a [Polysiphonia sertularioides]
MINLFTYNSINKYKDTVKKINRLTQELKNYSDFALKKRTSTLKNQIKENKIKNKEIIIEAFSTVKEAVFRSIGLELFDVQLIGGLSLNDGNIAEMKTGEGKTLVALLPAYLNSLFDKGVHIITVNDYLAKRDATLAQQIFSYLNVEIGLITQSTKSNLRKKEYRKDITYITNSELGFDYLKDNMAIRKKDVIQREFYYAVIDEVDSILIDEARTPLIISGLAKVEANFYENAQKIATVLKKIIDYNVEEKSKSIILTAKGIFKCEKILKIDNLYNVNSPWIRYILNALKAKELFLKNKDYIVRNNEIIIVDEFTGRVMNGRRWSEGLHQAVEAKEKVKIESENKVLASVTYQNLFLLYRKISGMTGTAKTEEAEFTNIYKMNVINIPTNKKCLRKDLPDLVYKNEYIKWQAIANECLDMYKIGRPTLIGTTSISKSELLSNMLNELQIPHNLLNAKPENVTQESDIILEAGKKNTITIATNMAGRGTDIILGGNIERIIDNLIRKYIKKKYSLNNDNEENTINRVISEIKTCKGEYEDHYGIEIKDIYSKYQKLKNEHIEICKKEKEEILNLGGLYVIGTERHESRRIDNQLRGRSGRQGDKGTSRFFLSIQDNLFRIFGGNQIEKIINQLNIDDKTAIESVILTKSLDSAQRKVEAYFYDIRKQLFEYDEVINNQRKAIYKERKKILDNSFTRDCIIEYGEQTIKEMLNIYYKSKNKEAILQDIVKILNIKIQTNTLDQMTTNEAKNYFNEQLRISYDLKEVYLEQLRPGLIRQLEKYYLLQQIDKAWQEHIDKMSLLKEYIGWRSYGQQDPLIEYKNEAFNLFINMITYIRQSVIYLVMRSRLIIDN